MKILSYCKLCDNRENNLEKGVICSLTSKIGIFSEECENFSKDDKELEKRNNLLKNLINQEYPDFSEHNKVKSNIIFEKVMIYESKITFIIGIIFSTILALVFFYKVYYSEIIYSLLIFSITVVQ